MAEKDQNKLIDFVSGLTILEAAELAKMLEEKWGVSAAAAGSGESEASESFTVVLVAAGDKKIEVIKEVRALTGLGLKEAKDLVEAKVPRPIREGLTLEEANKVITQLELAGASPEVRSVSWRSNLGIKPAAAVTQEAHREAFEIIHRITEWAGGPAEARLWFRSEGLPEFGGRTAEALVNEGRSAEVRDFLDHVALGGFT